MPSAEVAQDLDLFLQRTLQSHKPDTCRVLLACPCISPFTYKPMRNALPAIFGPRARNPLTARYDSWLFMQLENCPSRAFDSPGLQHRENREEEKVGGREGIC